MRHCSLFPNYLACPVNLSIWYFRITYTRDATRVPSGTSQPLEQNVANNKERNYFSLSILGKRSYTAAWSASLPNEK